MAYDNVIFSYPCPTCQHELTRWQTKDYMNMYNTYPITHLGNNSHIYTDCDNCGGKEITLIVKHITPPTVGVELWELDDNEDEPDEEEEMSQAVRCLGDNPKLQAWQEEWLKDAKKENP